MKSFQIMISSMKGNLGNEMKNDFTGTSVKGTSARVVREALWLQMEAATLRSRRSVPGRGERPFTLRWGRWLFSSYWKGTVGRRAELLWVAVRWGWRQRPWSCSMCSGKSSESLKPGNVMSRLILGKNSLWLLWEKWPLGGESGAKVETRLWRETFQVGQREVWTWLRLGLWRNRRGGVVGFGIYLEVELTRLAAGLNL